MILMVRFEILILTILLTRHHPAKIQHIFTTIIFTIGVPDIEIKVDMTL